MIYDLQFANKKCKLDTVKSKISKSKIHGVMCGRNLKSEIKNKKKEGFPVAS